MSALRKALLVLGLLASVHVPAAPITLNGDHFSVTYDSVQAGLYGQGFLAGSLDTVYFQPSTLFALSGGSPATTQTQLQLAFTIDPGYAFAGMTFTERGDYFIFGSGAADVNASVQAVNADSLASAILSLAPGAPLSEAGSSTPWELTGAMASHGLGVPQTLLVTLDNTLFASAPEGSLTFNQKTYAGFRVLTRATPTAVPEPGSVVLMLAGLLAALLVGRRQAAAKAHPCERLD